MEVICIHLFPLFPRRQNETAGANEKDTAEATHPLGPAVLSLWPLEEDDGGERLRSGGDGEGGEGEDITFRDAPLPPPPSFLRPPKAED